MPGPTYYATNMRIAAFEETISTADTTTLAEAVKTAFLLSLDDGLPLSQRAILNALGGKLRDQLRHLLGRVFDSGMEALATANSRIKTVNAELLKAKQQLDGVADAIEGLGKLVASLDTLLALVMVVL